MSIMMSDNVTTIYVNDDDKLIMVVRTTTIPTMMRANLLFY